MTIDSQLAMKGVGIDTATPIRQAQQDANANAESAQRVLGQYYSNLDAREQSRLQSTISGAAQLKVFLDNQDIEGAERFLTQRRQTLQQRMGAGEPIDTQDTDAALEMLRSGNIQELQNNVHGLLAAGQVYGIVDPTNGAGGSTGVLLDRLVREQHAAGNTAYTLNDALQDLKGGAGQAGKNAANIASGRQANYETQTGTNQSDLEYKPQIAQQSAEAQALGAASGDNKVRYEDFKASVPGLERTVNKLYQVADRATYTLTGQAANAFQRQLGFDPGDDAAARTYYTNLVRDEILPLLKPTFGAQFTVNEGEWLLATLGDPNLSPTEKRAALQARVDSWKNLIETMGNRAGDANAGQVAADAFSNFPPQQQILVVNPQTGESFMIDPNDLADAQAEGFQQQ